MNINKIEDIAVNEIHRSAHLSNPFRRSVLASGKEAVSYLPNGIIS